MHLRLLSQKNLLMKFFRKKQKTYEKTKEVFGNPLMGYAPCAWNESVRKDVTLLYMDITWAELEPVEGQFAWDAIDAENQVARWQAEGKHMVLRFVCDIPGNSRHMDIPEWLYEKTGHAGKWYDTAFGKGFAPDYSNEQFLAAHKKAVKAFGEHYGRSDLVSYVELGSLGHWGEWHVAYHIGIRRLPSRTVREQYVLPWLEAFPKAKHLMRRPFSIAKEYHMGVYNDMTGDADATERWLYEIANGGDYDQTNEKGELQSMPDFWNYAPSGGEFTSAVPMKKLLETELSQTINLIQKAHTTFLGPMTADAAYECGYNKVLQNLGYRLYISKAVLKPKIHGTSLEITWGNDGVAPFYQDWPVWIAVENEQSEQIEKKQLDLQLNNITPGIEKKVKVILYTPGLVEKAGNGYRISVGIEDPMTGKESVRLAMDILYEDGKNYLW